MNKYSNKPKIFFRNSHFQSIMASSRLRLRCQRAMDKNSREEIIDTSVGSRLLSFVTKNSSHTGTILYLHGWEGSSSSAYITDSADYFYRRGFSIIRLNLRDHGNSHHLNEGLFHGALMDETFEAVSRLASLSNGKPVYLIGFSLGGNFALRIALRHRIKKIAHLKHVFTISAPLDPYRTTLAIDHGYFFYRKYFLKKWKRSLIKKQRIFPHKYDFDAMLKSKTLIELTEKMMHYFPDMISYRDYFNLYTLKNDDFQNLIIPVTMFIAEDDPFIPHDDYLRIQESQYLRISRQKFGGHCGFLDLFPADCWYNRTIYAIIA